MNNPETYISACFSKGEARVREQLCFHSLVYLSFEH